MASAQEQHHGHDPATTSPQVRSLSDEEVKGYLEGRGMGLAKPAEMNSYPGPMHVLELADKLELTEPQRVETKRIFDRMRAEAIRLGKLIVEKEGELNRLFAGRNATRARLDSLVAEIGRLQADLRSLHLGAHLEMKELLSAKQVAAYDGLRGHRPAKMH